MNERVLLIEDDDAMRASLTQTLELEDITVLQANGLAQARRSIRANFAGVVLSDIRMPHEDGFSVLARVIEVDPDLPVVFLTGEADVPMAVRALRNGAYDFLEKPCATDDLLKSLKRALKHRQVVLQARNLERRLESSDVAAVHFPGATPHSTRLRSELRRVADLSVNIHFHGEPGVGKRLAAHTLQVLSSIETMPSVNFEDADSPDQVKKLAPQPGGFVLFKNVDAMRDADSALLREMTEDVLVISTGRHPIEALDGPARAIIAPLEPIEIFVPSLKQRSADLPVIFESLLRQAARDMNTDMPVASQDTLEAIQRADWAGNLPALRTFARQCVVGLPKEIDEAEAPGLAEQIDAFERQILIETLRRNNGKASQAAKDLKLARKTLYDRMARHGIRPRDMRDGAG